VAGLLTLTALVVLVPVLVQIARREYSLREAWGQLLIAAGMLVVAVGYGLFEGGTQGYLAVGGFVAALAGMLAVQRR
jgi:hypothetical protein